ncbi:hypothetical protein QFC21_005608 [Naganishia friedmannii]|uniref:Uncharacterized protein n=1 Tax=Naganishia friedmannii TaxID=89922 RepID=A0ACC2V7H4_9TREE|nr:hypothetical protein QFC21_005608 [Naganishia friedmannii]
MISASILQCLIALGLISGIIAAPAKRKGEQDAAGLLSEGECTPDVASWAWQSAPLDPSASSSTAVQDIVSIEAANIKLSAPTKAFALMLAHLSPGYMSVDPFMNTTSIKAWDDCKFRDHVTYDIDLFALDNNVCGMVVNASKAEFMDELQGNDDGLTLAPIIYEQLYLNLREDLPDLWCKGDEASCVADDTRTLFNHVIPLQIAKSKIGSLSDDKVREILNPSAASPVFLKDGESIAIITNFDAGSQDNWRGFYIDDPKAPKIWTLAQLQDATKQVSVMYSEIHSALPPMPVSQQGCTWLRDGTQEDNLEMLEPTSRPASGEDVKASGTAIAGTVPSSIPNLQAIKGGPALSSAGEPTARPKEAATESTLAPSRIASTGSLPSQETYSNDDDVPTPSHSEMSDLLPTSRPSSEAVSTGAPSPSDSADVLLPMFTLASGASYPSASAVHHGVILP